MAKMRLRHEDRVRLKAQILRMLVTLSLNREKMDLIAGFVDRYLELTEKEELALIRELDKVLKVDEKESVMELMTSWERKGRAEGRAEGELAVIKRLLVQRVGPLPPRIPRQLGRLKEPQLEALAEALLDLTKPKDLQSWLTNVGSPS